jgi:hypothetical protein
MAANQCSEAAPTSVGSEVIGTRNQRERYGSKEGENNKEKTLLMATLAQGSC